jgi:hypothetical protein
MSLQSASDVLKGVLLLLFFVSGVCATVAFVYRKGKAMSRSVRRPPKSGVDTPGRDSHEGSGAASVVRPGDAGQRR